MYSEGTINLIGDDGPPGSGETPDEYLRTGAFPRPRNRPQLAARGLNALDSDPDLILRY